MLAELGRVGRATLLPDLLVAALAVDEREGLRRSAAGRNEAPVIIIFAAARLPLPYPQRAAFYPRRHHLPPRMSARKRAAPPHHHHHTPHTEKRRRRRSGGTRDGEGPARSCAPGPVEQRAARRGWCPAGHRLPQSGRNRRGGRHGHATSGFRVRVETWDDAHDNIIGYSVLIDDDAGAHAPRPGRAARLGNTSASALWRAEMGR